MVPFNVNKFKVDGYLLLKPQSLVRSASDQFIVVIKIFHIFHNVDKSSVFLISEVG